MNVMRKFFAGVCAISALVQAAPAPSAVTDMVTEIEVFTETVWTTIDVTTTVWYNINQSPVQPPAASTTLAVVAASPTTTLTTSVTPAYTPPPAEYSTSTTTIAPVPTTTVQPTTTFVPAAPQTPASTAAAAPAPAVSAGSFAGAISASATNNCESSGQACEGDMTYYEGGAYGSCGWDVDTNNSMQIALPIAFMGAQSNGNPYCGRTVTIYNPKTGITQTGTVADKCPGCAGRAIDLTEKLFFALGGTVDEGRVAGVEWWFT